MKYFRRQKFDGTLQMTTMSFIIDSYRIKIVPCQIKNFPNNKDPRQMGKDKNEIKRDPLQHQTFCLNSIYDQNLICKFKNYNVFLYLGSACQYVKEKMVQE